MNFLKISIVSILITSCTFGFTGKASAGVWGESLAANFGAAGFSQMMDVIYDEVQAALVETLKREAIEAIQRDISNDISGSSQGEALFITDWEDYLYNTPNTNTQIYMNDFYTLTSNGKTSGNYESAGGCGSSYVEMRNDYAKSQTDMSLDLSDLQSDFDEYACGPENMFEGGTWEAFGAFMNPVNNPFSFSMIAEGIQQQRLEKEQKKAEIQAVAYQGFKASYNENGSSVITPGSTIKDIESHVNELSGDSLANANRPGEIVGAVVSKILGTVIKQGIGNIRQNIQSQVNNQACTSTEDLEGELSGLSSGSGGLGYGIGSLGSTQGGDCILQ